MMDGFFWDTVSIFVAPLFYTLLDLSCTAVLLGLVVLLLRRVFDKKISPLWKNVLWLLVIFALVMPNFVESQASIRMDAPFTAGLEHRNQQQWELESTYNTYLHDVPDDERVSPTDAEESQTLSQERIFWDGILPLIWLLGMVVMVVILMISHRKMLRNMRTTNGRPYDVLLADCKHQLDITQTVAIVEQSYLKSPALYGLFRPKILLPDYVSGMSEESQRYILLHELSHLKHCDLWKNALLLTLQVVYWFNPLVWVLFRFIRQDMELLNDTRVLQVLNKSEQTPYAMSLIEVLGHANHIPFAPQMLCMVDDKDNTKRRIQMIKLGETFKKHRIIISILCLAVIGVLSALFLTAKPETPSTVSPDSFLDCYLDLDAQPHLDVDIKWKDNFSGRTFTLEDNIDYAPEFAVYQDYYYTLAGQPDKIPLGENELYNMAAQNTVPDGKDIDIQSYTIHNIETYSPNQVMKLDDWARDNLDELTQTYYLVETAFVSVNVTWTHPDGWELLGPQIPPGTYDRGFLVGRTEANGAWKIYELYWMEEMSELYAEPTIPDVTIDPNEPIKKVIHTQMVDVTGDELSDVIATSISVSPEDADKDLQTLLNSGYLCDIAVSNLLSSQSEPAYQQSYAVAHTGNGQLSLVEQDGVYYLLEGNLYTGQGYYDFKHSVFSLDISGDRRIKSEAHISGAFDDVDAARVIADYQKDLNQWLDHAVAIAILDVELEEQLISTDKQTFSSKDYYDAKFDKFLGDLEPEAPVGDPRRLTADELAYFNETYFTSDPLRSDIHMANQFLHNPFDLPININLHSLFYLGAGADYAMNDLTGEYDAVAQAYGFDSWSKIPTDVTPIPRTSMDYILEQYTGIDLFATNKIGLDSFKYLAEYDCYYNLHGDTNYYGSVEFVWGLQMGDRITLSYYNGWQDADYVLTLVDYGGGDYKIYSNLPTTIEE